MRRTCLFSFFSSRRRHTRSLCDWSSDVCSSDLLPAGTRRQTSQSGYQERIVHSASESEADIKAMLRLRGGEDLALGELMQRWQEPLVSFIYRYTGNKEDALDLAQETFARVYESRIRYQPTAKFSTWLFKIAANLCRNHARWQERHPTVALHHSRDGDEPDAHNDVPA